MGTARMRSVGLSIRERSEWGCDPIAGLSLARTSDETRPFSDVSAIRTTLKLCHVLPRGMRYSYSTATSIDLFVSEMVQYSRQNNMVIAERAADPLPAPALVEMPSYKVARTLRRTRFIAEKIAKFEPDVVIVQQHLPSASLINRQVTRPVILQRHNIIENTFQAGLLDRVSYWRKVRSLNRLAGITFVSDFVLQHFERCWPDVGVPRSVIHNGYAIGKWNAQPVRENAILVVGRVAPEKGILEAAQAIKRVLSVEPGWNAKFILSEENVHPSYFAKIQSVIASLGDSADVQLNRPFEYVKAEFERAAIAVIPSKWAEPFGRTCLEAHAGGAAVISSGTGGLASISGDCALYVDPNDPRSIAGAISNLIADGALRKGLAQRGQERVQRLFGLETLAAKLDDFCLSTAFRAQTAAHPGP